MRSVSLLLLLASLALGSPAPWSARWISAAGSDSHAYGVYHFRKSIDLASQPSNFLIHVSADQRYQLFVNGTRAVWGPARGDLFHWRYESIDIARYLKPGRNVLAAVVWNFGPHTPVAQITWQTGFLLHGDTPGNAKLVDTNDTWKAVKDEAYSPIPITHAEVRGYYVAGPTERIDASKYPWGWEQPNFDDSAWHNAVSWEAGTPRDARDTRSPYMLVPRPIPFMEESPRRLSRVRLATAIDKPPANFPLQPVPLVIPPRTKARLLLDQNYLTSGYPELTVSRGKGASIKMGYAEALFDPKTRRKGSRSEVEGMDFIGPRDLFLPDGGQSRLFRTLWWRTWRYLELLIETKDDSLIVDDIQSTYTGYPFVQKSTFKSGSEELDRMLEVGWRTLRLCAHETYMDTPYYEQLQYVGDTRIQALATMYNTGDGRLARNAIDLINDSRTAEGATYSRAPSALQQYIPGFSLWWIGMVHDYWMYQRDEAFVKQMLPGVHAVLSFFAGYQKPDGSLNQLPWWPYVDWVRDWAKTGGAPPQTETGSSAPHDLQLLLAYQWAAGLEASIGSKALASDYRQQAIKLSQTINNLYWSKERKLFADTPAKENWSQHSNALAVLAGVVKEDEARDLMERVIPDKSLAQASVYFRYYLNAAAREAGLGDRYIDLLGEWRTMLDRGLTTWAEQPEPTRSDCHAWGASPNIELYRTVLGIDSAAPGFKKVIIAPHLGKLQSASGTLPHPDGEIHVSLERKGNGLHAQIDLPPGVEGEFQWNGVTKDLKAGAHTLNF